MDTNDTAHTTTTGAGYYFSLLRKHWLLTGLLAITCAAALFAYYAYQQKLYTAQAELIFELNTARVSQFDEVMDTSIERGLVEAAMNTHRERITSAQFAEETLQEKFTEAERARIFEDVSLQNNQPDELLLESILDVAWIPDSQIFEISATHQDPDTAALIANTYAESYIEQLERLRGEGTESAVAFLKEQSDELSSQIRKTQAAQQQFRQEHNLLSVEKERSLTETRIERLEEALADARIERIELRTTAKAIENAKGKPDQLLSISEISEFGNIEKTAQALDEARTQREVLSETLLERHPDVVENEAKIQSLEEALATNTDRAAQKLNRKLADRSEHIAQLESDLNDQESRIRELDQLAIEEDSILRTLDAQRLTNEQLNKRLNEATVTSRLRNTNVRMLSAARTPSSPSFPDPFAVSASAGLLFGIIIIGAPFMMEAGRTRLSTFAEIEHYLNKPVLCHINHDSKLKGRTIYEQREKLHLKESFRQLLAQLSLNTPDPMSGVYIVTSTEPGEGKSLVASNMALSFAQHGRKTLLIDTDLRRPRLHQTFNVDNDHGLLSWGEESGDPCDISAAKPLVVDDNLHLIRSGGSTYSPTEFVQDPVFIKLLHNLREEYDAIVLDSPPTGPCSDALILGAQGDHTVYVVRQNMVRKQRVRSGVHRHDQTDSPVTGIVLNDVHGKSADAAYGSAHSQYGVSYGYSENYYSTNTGSRSGKIRKNKPSPPVHKNGSNGRIHKRDAEKV